MFLSKQFLVCFILSVSLLISVVSSACPNDCSHRGLCINDKCVCAEGLTGSDCSRNAQSDLPTLYPLYPLDLLIPTHHTYALSIQNI